MPRLACLIALLLTCGATNAAQGPVAPIRVFILAGQSNMEGQGVVSMDHPKHYNGGKGNLAWSLQHGHAKGRMQHLRDADGAWRERSDVRVWFQARTGLAKGNLRVGFTGYGGRSHIGPELQFGHVVGDRFQEPVLLIKTAWGGKSLYEDFRPPSAGGTVGPYYERMLAEVKAALAEIPKLFAERTSHDYELSGFVWFQGWNDMCTKEAIPEYEQNLVHLVSDVRKALECPELPFVIGELGNMGPKCNAAMQAIRDAQKAAASRLANARFVVTHDCARPKELSPNVTHGHHWFGNAESYVLIGDALGRGMLRLLASRRPVKVYILSGQSNMVGMGDISGPSSRWGKQFLDPVVSVYAGPYSAEADYDRARPVLTKRLEKFGGVRPTPYPSLDTLAGGGTYVVRGHLRVRQGGEYRLKPGYASSTFNVMRVGGKEVHRREPGGESVFTPVRLEAGRKVPFRILYLTKSANGLGWIQRLDVPGTLESVVKRDGKFPHLVDGRGNWVVRDDVFYKGVVTAVGKGPLTVGLQGNTIGPELQFGHVMGDHHDEPVVILKTSQGNRSLGWDFLPPGSERFTFEGRTYAGYKDTAPSWVEGQPKKAVRWYAGKQYDDCFGAAEKVLRNFDEEFPQFAGRGYEVAGFVWWQGHKDGGSAAHASRYEQNLVRLIEKLRLRFDAPKAKFVIATIGFGGWKMTGNQLTVANAQLRVSGDSGRYPAFRGNVTTVETRDFWRDASVSPRSQGFHYNRNAETYLSVGDALGRGMLRLLRGRKDR